MNQLKVISNKIPEINFDLSTPEMLNKIIRAVRVFYVTALLLFVLLLQTSQSTFINVSMLLPVYALLSLSFLVNSIYLYYYEKVKNHHAINGIMFGLDAFFIAGMNLFADGNYTLFLILFLLNIILCGVKYNSRGAFLLAIWTSILFSGLLIYGPQLEGKNLYISLVLNNFSFFSIAYLAGFLSQQISSLTFEVASKTKDIENLQKLNQLIISNVGSGLISVDNHLRITQYNKYAKTLLNTELEGCSFDDIFGEVFDKIEPLLMSLKRGEVTRFETEMHLDNDQRIIEFVMSKIIDNQNVNSGFVVLFQDLTQLKSLEIKLRQKEKLAAVGQLAAGIAHEIRNPLASISGSIQLLAAKEGVSEDEKKRLMAITVKEIDRLNGLISEFLEYVKPEAKKEDIVDINVILKEIMMSVSVNKTLNANVQQDIQLASQKVIQGNPDKLKQALLNIVINAYQAMSKLDMGKIKIRTWDKADSLVVTIQDQGEGITPENLNRIFEPFHTTKAKGTGLGLAVAHKIFESHGANVHVESEINKGTVFIIEFLTSNNPIGYEMKIKKEA
ncbi:MAG: ATP-binding protein [Bdellovibrionales bacterium]|nr:ATP-binding protein [Bdellovibrionales bacterium]